MCLRWLLALLCLLGIVATPVAAQAPANQDATPRHTTQATLQVQHAAAFTEAPGRLDAPTLAALATLPTTEVALPHTWPRPLVPPPDAAQTHVRTSWFSVNLADAPRTAQGLWLYLPRWQTIGQIAVYADDRLVYRSHADLVWNGFNHPLLLPLDEEGRLPPPATLRLRIDGQTSAGGAVSSLWIGTAESLRARYGWRYGLQVRLPEWTSVVTLGLGLFTLVIWLWRRHERTYLLFALFALLSALRFLHFHLGLEPLPGPSAWFGWMTVNCVPALLVVWYYFVGTLAPIPARWPGRGLVLLLAVTTIATLPPLAVLPGMDVLAPLTYLIAVAAALPTTALLLWATWRHGNRQGIAAAWFLVADLGIAVHDLLMQNYAIGPENVYLGVLAGVPLVLLFSYVVLERYIGAVEDAEQSHARLARRLREREAELAQSQARLRAEQQRQLLLGERHRLTQDIHDGMGAQLMSALQVAERGQLSEARMARVLRECIEDLKLTVDSLEPVEADLLLLLATLRYRLGPKLHGTPLQLHWDVHDVPPLPWLDPRNALQVLRILHEAITRIIEQPGTRMLRVCTGLAGEGVSVTLEHDGPQPEGMAPGDTTSPDPVNLYRRARLIGGQIEWQPTAGGHRFVLWLPLRAPNAQELRA